MPVGPVGSDSVSRIRQYAESRKLGAPVDNGGGDKVHGWDGLDVQDFSGGADTENGGRCIVVDGPGGAHLVRNDFYRHYLEGVNHVRLGAPLEDEHWEDGRVVQRFERGLMAWSPNSGTQVDVTGEPGPQEIGDLVEGVYQSELGRASDPGGKAMWSEKAKGLRDGGWSDGQVRDWLVSKFRGSEEYKAKHTTGPGPVGTAPAAYKSMFESFEVTPGVSVPSHLGAHWGPATSYDNQGRIDAVADEMKKMGVGFSTIIVDAGNPGGMDKVIASLKARGIEPVVRMLPPGDYNKPLSSYSQDDIAKVAALAQHLRDAGVKLVQLDNEPNLEGLPKDGAAYDQMIDAYTKNEAALIRAIKSSAPGVAIGMPPMSPANDAFEQKFYQDNLSRLQQQDGSLLDGTFLATHPYDTGGQGSKVNQRYRDWAFEATGRHFNTLATEGGNPRNNRSEDGSWNIHHQDFLWMGQHPEDTQNLWIIADGYLNGGSGGNWEMDALIHADGHLDTTVRELERIVSGERQD
jgi:hypothetical protein